ncbi:1-phosphatidylinositol phosphodiesterase [Ceratocystis lukuohia]|uniref:1-phosphatidylinositol phosphodiesterase n=1 Tax=Ceratocystis lukuohia TaxID=2019550 RepID=A0ABR4MTH4_9PEZI
MTTPDLSANGAEPFSNRQSHRTASCCAWLPVFMANLSPRAVSRWTAVVLVCVALLTLNSLTHGMRLLMPCVESPTQHCYRGYTSAWSFNTVEETVPPVPPPPQAEWMSGLPDAANISSLSLPGTHDTMTFSIPDEQLQCQNHNLTTQLTAGVRYIDARTRLQGDQLGIYHSYQSTGHTFAEVMTIVFDFLDAHPSEAIVVRIKEEGPRLGNGTKSFEEAFNALRLDSPDLAPRFEKHLYMKPNPQAPLPTLGEMRGKILILQEFPATEEYGIRWRSTHIVLEDLWIIPSLPHLEIKWEAIHRALVRSATEPDTNTALYLSHLSASIGVLPIEAAAGPLDGTVVGMNDRTGTWLEKQPKARRGIVIIDFPGQALLDAVIGQNAPLMQESRR